MISGGKSRAAGWGRAVLAAWMAGVGGLAMALDPKQAEPLPDEALRAATGPLVEKALFLDAARAGERIVAVGERGIILYSDDEGASWQQAAVPAQVTLTAITFTGTGQGWAVGHDATILHSKDRGATWTFKQSDPDLEAPLLDVTFDDPQRGFAVGARGTLYTTRDGGGSWQHNVVYGPDEFDGHLFGIARSGEQHFLASEAGVIQRSADGGESWEILESGYDGSMFGVLALPGGRLLAYAMLGNVFYSDDGGATWQRAQSGMEQSFMTGLVTSDGSVVLAGLDGAVAVSRDGGTTFTDHSLPGRANIADLLPLQDGEWLAFGDQGIVRLSADFSPVRAGDVQ